MKKILKKLFFWVLTVVFSILLIFSFILYIAKPKEPYPLFFLIIFFTGLIFCLKQLGFRITETSQKYYDKIRLRVFSSRLKNNMKELISKQNKRADILTGIAEKHEKHILISELLIVLKYRSVVLKKDLLIMDKNKTLSEIKRQNKEVLEDVNLDREKAHKLDEKIILKKSELKELNNNICLSKEKYRLEQIEMRNTIDSLNKEINNKERHISNLEQIFIDMDLSSIKEMNGLEFEYYIARLLSFAGYSNIKRTQDSNDQGLDVIAEKNNLKYGIQCKLYSTPVGNSAVQQAIAGTQYYGLDRAVVITNSTFTDSAITLALKTNVSLINNYGLYEIIKKAVFQYEYVPYKYKQIEII
ncbi:restriction endonuclease [Liquorilactobacillus nagelii]|uniref:restriction endonuclease n=1 Tax=Liquorilactobacillus nagelii TaxID=82688 RepID=UPI0006EF38EF|nr:restriction endonuclease [Liquorilactobacillus nagelii]KRL39878.1 hypothetical protein FD45_GL000052 [Liquorilactobacillus nagelii DSM 13675]QYH53396.1 restriction endonuclease [Liquorilactobacillus nagelii DSM 13675]